MSPTKGPCGPARRRLRRLDCFPPVPPQPQLCAMCQPRREADCLREQPQLVVDGRSAAGTVFPAAELLCRAARGLRCEFQVGAFNTLGRGTTKAYLLMRCLDVLASSGNVRATDARGARRRVPSADPWPDTFQCPSALRKHAYDVDLTNVLHKSNALTPIPPGLAPRRPPAGDVSRREIARIMAVARPASLGRPQKRGVRRCA